MERNPNSTWDNRKSACGCPLSRPPIILSNFPSTIRASGHLWGWPLIGRMTDKNRDEVIEVRRTFALSVYVDGAQCQRDKWQLSVVPSVPLFEVGPPSPSRIEGLGAQGHSKPPHIFLCGGNAPTRRHAVLYGHGEHPRLYRPCIPWHHLSIDQSAGNGWDVSFHVILASTFVLIVVYLPKH
jgi:hypothetical protein